jgi:isoleucyl-tRNA synthetase
MIANRPDWCISRQRVWGVPIPALDCTKCGEAIITPAIVEQAASVFERYGADAWYERATEDFVPAGLTCAACGGRSFEREMNILDVWFDSGSSHEAVLSVWPELTWPADIYLEGSDQHRGWFQSSLMVGLGTRGRPPFRQVLTHGFIVAEDGRKMSKSLGNSIEPQDVIKQSGADIIRLWVSMSDYTQEIRLSREILARVVEAYRKIRNTFRYLSANLYDFDPVADRVTVADMEAVDRYILARYAEIGRRVLRAYEQYDYGTIFQALNTFCTVDLSAFYADVSKDRLYTFAARSRERRSAQTAMYVMADGLTRLMAPILSFTADELWRFLPGSRDASVHLALFPSAEELETLDDSALIGEWTRLIGLRERVLAEIEPLRKNKVIGSSLQAKVVVAATPAELAFLEPHAHELPMLFIVSEVELTPAPTDVVANEEALPRVSIERAPGVKCERCWRYVPSISTEPEWAGLCERCRAALADRPASGDPLERDTGKAVGATGGEVSARGGAPRGTGNA